MTILIQKNRQNNIALTDILLNASRTFIGYEMTFTNDTEKTSQTLPVTITQDGNRFQFEITEGTDITFDLLGFYTWELYGTLGSKKFFLQTGKMKVTDTRTESVTPVAISTQQTYVVANGGQ